jgi:Protein of unknown function (DUF3485)
VFRAFSTVTVFVAFLMAGLVPGLWAGRWSGPAALDEADAWESRVPFAVGEWAGQDLEINPREREATQASGFLYRRYVNARTGGAVKLIVLAGRSGPIAVHTPDVCYRGSGYDEVGTAVRYDIPGALGNQLWVRRFQKASAAPIYVRVWYGWTAAGTWMAPDKERLAFAGLPRLYKMYVIRELTGVDEPLDGDPVSDFLRDLVSPLRAALFPAA